MITRLSLYRLAPPPTEIDYFISDYSKTTFIILDGEDTVSKSGYNCFSGSNYYTIDKDVYIWRMPLLRIAQKEDV